MVFCVSSSTTAITKCHHFVSLHSFIKFTSILGTSSVLLAPRTPIRRSYSYKVIASKNIPNAASNTAVSVGTRQFMTAAVDLVRTSSKVLKEMSNEDWSKKLTPEQYSICRLGSTEPPYSGKYCDFWNPGTYTCICCSAPLFRSEDKFDSACGWPAFSASIESNVAEQSDLSHGMKRTEVVCSSCKSHLGHVFNDGPPPTGIRYCINSMSLNFTPV